MFVSSFRVARLSKIQVVTTSSCLFAWLTEQAGLLSHAVLVACMFASVGWLVDSFVRCRKSGTARGGVRGAFQRREVVPREHARQPQDTRSDLGCTRVHSGTLQGMRAEGYLGWYKLLDSVHEAMHYNARKTERHGGRAEVRQDERLCVFHMSVARGFNGGGFLVKLRAFCPRAIRSYTSTDCRISSLSILVVPSVSLVHVRVMNPPPAPLPTAIAAAIAAAPANRYFIPLTLTTLSTLTTTP